MRQPVETRQWHLESQDHSEEFEVKLRAARENENGINIKTNTFQKIKTTDENMPTMPKINLPAEIIYP